MLELDVHLRRGGFSLNLTAAIEADAVGLIGPSGCGKTTLLHCIAGLVRPDSGRIAVSGRVLFDSAAGIDVPIHKRRVGVVFQDGRLLPHKTVRGNLAYGMKLSAGGERRFELAEIAEMLEITALLDRSAGAISGGQARRVAIGRAILACPKLLLLDEPLTGLDERLRGEILPLLGRLPEATGIPILCVSHHLDEVLALTRRLLQMRDGRLVFSCDGRAEGQGPALRARLSG